MANATALEKQPFTFSNTAGGGDIISAYRNNVNEIALSVAGGLNTRSTSVVFKRVEEEAVNAFRAHT